MIILNMIRCSLNFKTASSYPFTDIVRADHPVQHRYLLSYYRDSPNPKRAMKQKMSTLLWRLLCTTHVIMQENKAGVD